MRIHLIRARTEDAKEIWNMQLRSFADLLARYQDFETNPGNEPLEKIEMRLKQPFTYFYFICADQEKVGAVRVMDGEDEGARKRISPLFILPAYRGKGYAQSAIELCEELHGKENWELSTILQEKGNCHLYEKMEYQPTGTTVEINERFTLIIYRKNPCCFFDGVPRGT